MIDLECKWFFFCCEWPCARKHCFRLLQFTDPAKVPHLLQPVWILMSHRFAFAVAAKAQKCVPCIMDYQQNDLHKLSKHSHPLIEYITMHLLACWQSSACRLLFQQHHTIRCVQPTNSMGIAGTKLTLPVPFLKPKCPLNYAHFFLHHFLSTLSSSSRRKTHHDLPLALQVCSSFILCWGFLCGAKYFLFSRKKRNGNKKNE